MTSKHTPMRPLPTFLFIVLLGATLTPDSAAQTVAAVSGPGQNAKTPRITAVLNGPRTAVFEYPQNACNENDLPDAMARAFRDSAGTIHFVTAGPEMFASLGPTLESLQRDCHAAHYPAGDPNPADYNDQVWIDSFWTNDGVTIAGLGHTEYHGWAHPGECHSQNYSECEYDSDTFHLSKDGGYHFGSFKAPYNVVATVPYKYVIDHGPVGYSVDSNIIQYGGWYYAIATDDGNWPPGCSGQTGPHHCKVPNGAAPIRTTNVFDPTSWRSWNGTDFSVSFVDPYAGPVADPEQYVYTPVRYLFATNGLNVYQPLNVAVAVLWDYWDTELGPRGLYLTTSIDMVHWTEPTLVVTLADILKNDPKGSWLYAYFSLIDPAAPDMSFSVIGNTPYLYYVRLDNNGNDRVVFRQPLTLSPAE